MFKTICQNSVNNLPFQVKSGKGSEPGKRKRKHNGDVDSHRKHSHSKKHKSDKEKREDRPHKKNKHEDSKGVSYHLSLFIFIYTNL